MARGYVSRISIHAAREGGDGIVLDETEFTVRFQSTPPVKAATNWYVLNYDICVFQSTPPVKAATREYVF